LNLHYIYIYAREVKVTDLMLPAAAGLLFATSWCTYL